MEPSKYLTKKGSQWIIHIYEHSLLTFFRMSYLMKRGGKRWLTENKTHALKKWKDEPLTLIHTCLEGRQGNHKKHAQMLKIKEE